MFKRTLFFDHLDSALTAFGYAIVAAVVYVLLMK